MCIYQKIISKILKQIIARCRNKILKNSREDKDEWNKMKSLKKQLENLTKVVKNLGTETELEKKFISMKNYKNNFNSF